MPHLEFDKVINAANTEPDVRLLQGTVLVLNASVATLKKVLLLVDSRKLPDLDRLCFQVANIEDVEKTVKSEFKIIKAAGGIVVKDGKILLMKRMGQWDLPKGKLESSEKARAAAIREIEEECGVQSEIIDKLCSTWHSYNSKGKRILKKTKWFVMQCIHDEKMSPQIEESIEEVAWKTIEEAGVLLGTSYASIEEVFLTFKANYNTSFLVKE